MFFSFRLCPIFNLTTVDGDHIDFVAKLVGIDRGFGRVMFWSAVHNIRVCVPEDAQYNEYQYGCNSQTGKYTFD